MHYPTASPMAWANTSACNYSCGRCVAGLKNLGLVSCGLNWTELALRMVSSSAVLLLSSCVSPFRKNFELHHQIQRFTESCRAVYCILESMGAEKNLESRLMVIYIFLVFLDYMSKTLKRELNNWRASHCWSTLLHPRGSSAVTFLSRDPLVPREVARSPATEIFETPQITLVVLA